MKEKILLGLTGAALCLAACSGSGSKTAGDTTTKDTAIMAMADSSKSLKPKSPKPAWGADLKPEMQAVLEKLDSYGDKPIPQLTAPEARKNHTPTDAVMDLMKENNILMPALAVDTTGKDIPGGLHVRIYTPKSGNGPFPVIVYYHGGGFVIANLDVYDATPKTLSDMVGAVVVSVAYRLAPEHKFPAAHEDAYTAYKWVVDNAASIKGDPQKIALAGESAGGNLAVNTAIKARDKGVMLPTAILTVYPVAQSDMNTDSYIKNAGDKPLNKPMMAWFVKNYLNNMAEAKDPRINLVAANLKGLPTTTIITDQYDPLHDDGTMLADKMKAAGVNVDTKNYDGVTHEFFGMGAVVPQAKEAETYAAGQLKKAFGK
ncbi:alpha/beta hydrolase [Mucilaginibacter sp. CAU 1740]|uniref:alpha/beta hydrolase n=1 Tax=Mucilaginibacter sp. CAU 1740 TaxID=3140365 RepID=UPI00325AF27E